jgi:hypothetical protein
LAVVETTILPEPAVALLARFLAAGGLVLCDETTRLPASLATQPRVIHLAGSLEQRFQAAAETPDADAQAALLAEVRALLDQAGLQAQARADHAEVETSVLSADDMAVLITVNHAAEPVTTNVHLRGRAEPLRLTLPARHGRLTRLTP